MQELIKNVLYLGAGAAFMTKEKIEELKKDFIDKGKMTQEEGKKFVDDMIKKSEKAKEDLEKNIQKMITDKLDKMNVATKDDIADLHKQVADLKKMMDKAHKSEN